MPSIKSMVYLASKKRGKGWHGDKRRHQLAGMGIKSGGKVHPNQSREARAERREQMKLNHHEIEALIKRKVAETRHLMESIGMTGGRIQHELAKYRGHLNQTYGLRRS